MRGRGWKLLLVCLPMLLGMRDPFQPPRLNCPGGKTGEWRYSGLVVGKTALGIVRDAHGRWLRVRPGELLSTGWRVEALNEMDIVIDTLAACEPQRWRWPREGTTQHENRDSRAVTDLLPNAVR
jgi:pilus assembly protein HofP